MNNFSKLKRKTSNFLFDHFYLRETLKCIGLFFLAVLSAFIFSFSFTTFITPHSNDLTIVTGGVSGLSQTAALVIEMIFDKTLTSNQITAIGYTVFNIPLLLFAFFKLSKRFAIFSFVTVVFSSLFIILLSKEGSFTEQLANATFELNGESTLILSSPLIRSLISGLFAGISCSIPFACGFSSGGIDIVTYFIGSKKSAQVGKYSIIISGTIISIYGLLLVVNDFKNNWARGLYSIIFSSVYLFMISIVVDFIHLRDKKVQIEVITEKESLGDILISHFPHGVTLISGKGVYSGKEKYIFVMKASSNETKNIVSIIKKADKNCFISVSSLIQIYGNFFVKPID